MLLLTTLLLLSHCVLNVENVECRRNRCGGNKTMGWTRLCAKCLNSQCSSSPLYSSCYVVPRRRPKKETRNQINWGNVRQDMIGSRVIVVTIERYRFSKTAISKKLVGYKEMMLEEDNEWVIDTMCKNFESPKGNVG
ncbi:hypothetical protein BU17DRAFT_68564 [Hysterangium stoloniferum]|nr:hypothetical protein BU17DRAFT_68564 [Hysterangium stoloniferum]